MAERVKIHIEDAPVKDIVLPEGMEKEIVVKILQKFVTLREAGRYMFGGLHRHTSRIMWRWFMNTKREYENNRVAQLPF